MHGYICQGSGSRKERGVRWGQILGGGPAMRSQGEEYAFNSKWRPQEDATAPRTEVPDGCQPPSVGAGKEARTCALSC